MAEYKHRTYGMSIRIIPHPLASRFKDLPLHERINRRGQEERMAKALEMVINHQARMTGLTDMIFGKAQDG